MELDTLKMAIDTMHKARLKDAKAIATQANEIKTLKAENERLSMLVAEREHPLTTIFMQAYGNIELDARTKENERRRQEVCNLESAHRLDVNWARYKLALAHDVILDLWHAWNNDDGSVAGIMRDLFVHGVAQQTGWQEPDEESDQEDDEEDDEEDDGEDDEEDDGEEDEVDEV